jgi:hypothetical protein
VSAVSRAKTTNNLQLALMVLPEWSQCSMHHMMGNSHKFMQAVSATAAPPNNVSGCAHLSSGMQLCQEVADVKLRIESCRPRRPAVGWDRAWPCACSVCCCCRCCC